MRFRHEDTDLVRSARQQDFLREARQKLSPEQIIRDSDYRGELVDIFTDYTTSDLSSATELLKLIRTFIGAASATVNEVHFPAELGGPDSLYVTADQDEIKEAVQQFLGTEGTPGPPPEGSSRRRRLEARSGRRSPTSRSPTSPRSPRGRRWRTSPRPARRWPSSCRR